ncbi:MAG TPA: hypothetical protein VG345_13135 [Bryobacteraceae bacterium]|nr:hypothetical protein [Bryobacteraceae bacterium]
MAIISTCWSASRGQWPDGPAVNAHPVALEEAMIRQQRKALHMPTIAA